MYQEAWLIMNESEDTGAADKWSFTKTQTERVLVTVRAPLRTVQEAHEFDDRRDSLGYDVIETAVNLRIEHEIPPEWIVSVEPVERVMDSWTVQAEYGVVPTLDELPSDARYPWEETWWESSVSRWFHERR